jgi:hypothetical protein
MAVVFKPHNMPMKPDFHGVLPHLLSSSMLQETEGAIPPMTDMAPVATAAIEAKEPAETIEATEAVAPTEQTEATKATEADVPVLPTTTVMEETLNAGAQPPAPPAVPVAFLRRYVKAINYWFHKQAQTAHHALFLWNQHHLGVPAPQTQRQ